MDLLQSVSFKVGDKRKTVRQDKGIDLSESYDSDSARLYATYLLALYPAGTVTNKTAYFEKYETTEVTDL